MSRSMLSRLFSWFRPASISEVKDTDENDRLEAGAHVDDDWYRFMIFGYKPHGDSLEDILWLKRIDFDTKHDFIQWMFPNRSASPINPLAPRLEDKHLALYKFSGELRKQVGRSIAKFLRFLGIEEVGGELVRTGNYEKGFQYWVCRFDHNHKRISRLLTFLCEIGEREQAEVLLSYLERELAAHDLLGIEAVPYWRAIMTTPVAGVSR